MAFEIPTILTDEQLENVRADPDKSQVLATRENKIRDQMAILHATERAMASGEYGLDNKLGEVVRNNKRAIEFLPGKFSDAFIPDPVDGTPIRQDENGNDYLVVAGLDSTGLVYIIMPNGWVSVRCADVGRPLPLTMLQNPNEDLYALGQQALKAYSSRVSGGEFATEFKWTLQSGTETTSDMFYNGNFWVKCMNGGADVFADAEHLKEMLQTIDANNKRVLADSPHNTAPKSIEELFS